MWLWKLNQNWGMNLYWINVCSSDIEEKILNKWNAMSYIIDAAALWGVAFLNSLAIRITNRCCHIIFHTRYNLWNTVDKNLPSMLLKCMKTMKIRNNIQLWPLLRWLWCILPQLIVHVCLIYTCCVARLCSELMSALSICIYPCQKSGLLPRSTESVR